SDHLLFSCKTLKEGILSYLRTQGIDLEGGRIMLMTHLRTLGYVFNPVSFYFCFDRQDQPVCAIAEVGNTFGEMKPYFFNQKTLEGDSFNMEMAKYFYVSPFIGLDSHFDFKLKVPSEKLNIKIDGYEKDAKMLVSTLTGKRQELADSKLFWYSLKFPAVTVKVIALIHWHALKLYLNKLPYYKKDSHLDLQRGVHHGKKTT
ncbi:MAG: DUF1365 domain-containing protein, partial [Blastocatellia bacterium]|nr:DUF1365 domain-containing protein [Blastocatellia bacterium]